MSIKHVVSVSGGKDSLLNEFDELDGCSSSYGLCEQPERMAA